MTRPVTTYYDTLQVARSASDGVIRAAYRSLSQRYHPDKHPDKLQWANQMMRRLNEAYEVLSDPERRATYDRRLTEHEATRPSEPVRQARGTNAQSIPTLTPEQAAEWAEKQRAKRERRLREEATERARRAERERSAPAHRQSAKAPARESVQSTPADMQKSTRSGCPIGWKTLVACMFLGGYLGASIGIVGFGGGISGMVPGVIAGFFLWGWLKNKFARDSAASAYVLSNPLGRAAKSLWQGFLVLLRWASIAAIVAFIGNAAINYDRYARSKQEAASVAPAAQSPAYQAPTYSAPPPLRPQPAPETKAQYDATDGWNSATSR